MLLKSKPRFGKAQQANEWIREKSDDNSCVFNAVDHLGKIQ